MPLCPFSARSFKSITIIILVLSQSLELYGQSPDDSIEKIELSEVIVKAYAQNRRYNDMPAAVNVVNKNTLSRFNSFSVVQAVNSLPGVRMEERSPGSYRINIRGSSIRSPFGVRNVKVYYNDIPYTDPGGQTYLNQLGYYNYGSMEIIKGPSSSLYGAGTGGALLIENINEEDKPGLNAHYTLGSYNTSSLYLSLNSGNVKFLSNLSLQHYKSDGYRNHSELKREIYSWSGLFKLSEDRELKTSFFFGDLFYETPGALTKAEFDNNPLAFRPGSAVFPSAENAKAAVKQKSFLVGASYSQKLFKQLDNQTVLYGVYTELKNPTIRNYGRTTEPHAGGRTIFNFKDSSGVGEISFKLGGEWQEGFPGVAIHRNLDGNADSLQTLDEINNRQRFIFLQGSVLKNGWSIDAGLSLNWYDVRFNRLIPTTDNQDYKLSMNQVAPRFALGKKFNRVFIYSTVAKGFSPPTTSEWLPTGSNINLNLKAEQGINADIGIRSRLGRLYADVNFFRFSLKNTIVQRRDAGGGDFFINAGKTSQTGIETMLNYRLPVSVNGFNANMWLNHVYHRFRYKDFIQLNENYSGNRIPGIAPHTLTTGSDISFRRLYLYLSYIFSDQTPLNDNNSEFAPSYHIINAKIGFKDYLKDDLSLQISAGIENLLGADYSLGFDVNGFGGRYYNAAPGRNFYLTVAFGWHK